MRWLVGLCLRRRGTVAILTLLALVFGAWGALQVPLDVFPEFLPPTVTIQTEAPGLTPQLVEQLVTTPIENAINGAPGLAAMRSESIPGLSVITIQFRDGTNLYTARQSISEKLSELGNSLPTGVDQPRLSPLVSSTMDLLMVGLVSDKIDDYTLRDRADWLLKPALLAVPGVANVIIFGGAVRQIHIQPDPQKLTGYGFTPNDLAAAARSALSVRGAGFIDTAHQRVILQSPIPAPDPAVIANALLTVRSKTPIRLSDVAAVMQAPALRSGDALVMGKHAVMLWITGQYGSNTLATTKAIETALKGLTPRLEAEGVHVYPALQRSANFIERALANLETALVIAAILILIVLYAFLRDWRSALITFLSIPLSVVAAIWVLGRFGYTLNTMTLGGLAVSLGVLVDDAIIGIENVLRRLRANADTGHLQSRITVILDASVEVRGPIIYATIIVIAVFLPELFASGVQGRLIGPLALAFILAVLASLAVALTTTPALCAILLTESQAHVDSSWLIHLKNLQARAIAGINNHFKAAIAAVGITFAIAVAILPFLGGTFMPDFKEGHFVMYAHSAPGTSLDEMMRVGKRIQAAVLKLPYVKTVEQQIGRAELSEDTYGTNASEFHVELNPEVEIDQEDTEKGLHEILSRYPGLQTEIVTFLGDRINDSITGETAAVAVRVYGNDLDALDKAGNDIVRAISDVPGIRDLQFARQSGTPQFNVQLSSAALRAYGLKRQDVLDAIQANYAGMPAGQTYAGTRSVDVVLLQADRFRDRPEALQGLMISGPLGTVPLSNVATVRPTEGRYDIRHYGGARFVSVTFNVEGASLQSAAAAAKVKIDQTVALPPSTYFEFVGAAETERAARVQLMLYSGFALALIVMVLFTCFRWPAHAWLVLANLPFSLIGGIFAVGLTGLGLSLGALVGLVTVFGISARNAILLLAHYEQLVLDEGSPWTAATVVRGAQERLIPILMTAAVTALGLLPLALGLSKPGHEIEGPMAVAVLGGLLTSTFLNLILLPVLAQRFGRKSMVAD